jgi:hypothetical protein
MAKIGKETEAHPPVQAGWALMTQFSIYYSTDIACVSGINTWLLKRVREQGARPAQGKEGAERTSCFSKSRKIAPTASEPQSGPANSSRKQCVPRTRARRARPAMNIDPRCLATILPDTSDQHGSQMSGNHVARRS